MTRLVAILASKRRLLHCDHLSHFMFLHIFHVCERELVFTAKSIIFSAVVANNLNYPRKMKLRGSTECTNLQASHCKCLGGCPVITLFRIKILVRVLVINSNPVMETGSLNTKACLQIFTAQNRVKRRLKNYKRNAFALKAIRVWIQDNIPITAFRIKMRCEL